jgi:hypothetical protein
MRETLQQAQRSNDGRPTCCACGAPCGVTREWLGSRLCAACYDSEPIYTKPKELLCKRILT